MKSNYKVQYKESRDVLESICRLYTYDNSEKTFKFILGAMGPLVLIFMFIYGSHGGDTPQGIALFVLKYLVCYGAIFAAAMFINRTVWKKMSKLTALGDADELYEKRVLENQKVTESEMEFFEDHFFNTSNMAEKGKGKEYTYDRVIAILESKEALGLVVRASGYEFGGPKGLFGFPKKAMVEGDMEEFKTFLLEKCPNVKRGIKKF